MPKALFQRVVFTVIMAAVMVYIMGLYNTALNFIVALPVQVFVAGPLARAVFRRLFCAGEAACGERRETV